MPVNRGKRNLLNGRKNRARPSERKDKRGGQGFFLDRPFCLLTLEPHPHGKTAFEIVGVRPMSIWWSRKHKIRTYKVRICVICVSLTKKMQIPSLCLIQTGARGKLNFLHCHYDRKILLIGFPLANSSINLSKYLIFCINGSWISSTRIPHIVPLINVQFGFMWGASLKKVL